VRLGLRFLTVILLLAGVLPTTAVLLASSRDNLAHVRGATRREVAALARMVAEQHQRSVDTARGTLLAISRLPAVRAFDSAGCIRALGAVGAATDLWANMGAVRPDGQMYCSAFPMTGPVNLADRAFVQGALRTGDIAAGIHVVSRVRGIGAFGFGYPVRDDAGTIVAVTFASLRTDTLQRQLEALPLPPRVSITVVDRAGAVVTSRPEAGGPAGERLDPEVVRLAMSGESLRERIGDDGVSRVYAFAPVVAVDGPAMFVVAGVPTETVEEPVRAFARRTLGTWFVASLAVILGTGLIAEFLLIRRLSAISRAAARIAAGDYRARTGLRARRDELGDLAVGFDQMAASLEEGAAVALRDATDRQRLEEQLHQAQKMEAVGQLAGGVAHDFNNLLTAIITCGRMVQEALPPEHPAQPDVDEILASGDRAAQLTRQLLAFARRQRLAPRAVDLRAVVGGMERMLRRVLGETVALRFVSPPEPIVIHADPGQIELVVLNLAVNARDAMPEGGELVITQRAVDPGDPALAAGEPIPPGPLGEIVVRDTGVGMDPDTQQRIFEPFFSTKPVGKGTGLGLATVYGIVKQSGGAIRVRSAPGRGTEFRILFPLHRGAADAEPRPARAASGGDERILVLEDDDVLRALVCRALKGAGYRVLEAARPSAAADRAAEHELDLLLTDLVLPEESGWSLYRRIAAGRPGLRVLLMSGFSGAPEPGSVSLPADVPFLAKPFGPSDLLARVRQALDRPPPSA